MRQWVRDAKRRHDLTVKHRHRDPGSRWKRLKDDRRSRAARQLTDE